MGDESSAPAAQVPSCGYVQRLRAKRGAPQGESAWLGRVGRMRMGFGNEFCAVTGRRVRAAGSLEDNEKPKQRKIDVAVSAKEEALGQSRISPCPHVNP